MKSIRSKNVAISLRDDENSFRLVCALADFVLLNVAFFVLNYINRGSFIIASDYIRLLWLFYIIWGIVSPLMKKFHLKNVDFRKGIFLQIESTVMMAYSMSFFIVFFGLSSYSRVHIFGTFMLLLMMETALIAIISSGRIRGGLPLRARTQKRLEGKPKVSLFLLISDFMLLTASFYFMNFYKRGTFHLTSEYEKILLLIFGLWFVSAIITQKFNLHNFQNYYYALAAGVKSTIFLVFSLSLIIFAFRLFIFSRLQIFGTLLLFLILEAVLTYFYFVMKFGKEPTGDIESIDEVQDFFGQKDLPLAGEQKKFAEMNTTSFMKMLSERYLKSLPGLYKFVSSHLDLSTIDDHETAIINSPDLFNIKILKENTMRLLINIYKINDIRWINRYFLELHQCLINGGFFIGRVNTISTHKSQFFKKYPRYLAEILYTLHFIFFRVFPKLPKLRKVYFSLTKGKNRMISKAEILGRLCFCGYKIVAAQEIDGSMIFIAQKTKTPSLDQNPSYSPIIKLKRCGLQGRVIEVYKFRTMYPYSEYLQEYIYEQQKLEAGGKINRDFRVTDWGKIMRRYWLDELPMLYNWIRGELKLFGVRPLSRHYLSLYDNYLQKMRKKVKPGLIPPYYADLPHELNEINESEKKYIQSYLEHPLRTQIRYFLRVLNNILIKGVRSS